MNWELIVEYIQEGMIIPVLGPDLVQVKTADNQSVPLYDYIAGELIRKHQLEHVPQKLEKVAEHQQWDDIHQEIRKIYRKIPENKLDTTLIRKLINITDFHCFITTAFDNALEQSLIAERKYTEDQLFVVSNTITRAPEPMQDLKRTKATLFHLLGNINGQQQFALSEKGFYRHFYAIFDEKSWQRERLLENVGSRRLLFIGNQFPEWLMLFMIRLLESHSYIDNSKPDLILPQNTADGISGPLQHFPSRFRLVEEDKATTPKQFIDALFTRWQSAQEAGLPIRFKGQVFISYNSRNHGQVKPFKEALRARGVEVWFDEDNLAPGEHRKDIHSRLKECKFFLLMISEELLQHPESYTWTEEASFIKMRHQADQFYGEPSFTIYPLILGDLKRTDQRIPEFFRQFAMRNLPEEQDKIIDEITDKLEPL